MPFAVDESKLKEKTSANQAFDMHKPPLRNIPHQEYPKTMYLWPRDKSLHPVHDNTVERDAQGNTKIVTDFNRTSSSRIKTANTADEEKLLRNKGYRDKPHTQQLPEELPDEFEADLPEAAGKGKKD